MLMLPQRLSVLLVTISRLIVAFPAVATPPFLCEDRTTGDLIARVNVDSCPESHSHEWRGAAVNIFDSFWVTSQGMTTCCNATGGPATKIDAVNALKLAASNGVRVFRFFATLWGPNCVFALQHSEIYWKEFDEWWDVVDELGLFAIPSIGAHDWHYASNETLNDLILVEHSEARAIAINYTRAFVQRYSKRKSLLFWELGNELNLMVDLPAGHCNPTAQCFDTKAMVDFQVAIVNAIRSSEVDRLSSNPFGLRPVSSGFSAPRPSAWHQAHFPVHDARYWEVDSRTEWLSMLEKQNAAVDIWSVHMYDNDKGDSNTSLLSAAVSRARERGAMLFLGEYGGHGPNFTGPSAASRRFPQLCLDAQVEDVKNGTGGFALSAIWAWVCPSHRRDMVCIWPGEPDGPKESGTKPVLRMLSKANKLLQEEVTT